MIQDENITSPQDNERGYTEFLQSRGLDDIKLTGSVRQVLDVLNQHTRSQENDAGNEHWKGENGRRNIIFLAAFSHLANEAGMKSHDIRTAMDLMAEHIDKGKTISEVVNLTDGIWQTGLSQMTSMTAPFNNRGGNPVRFTIPADGAQAVSLRMLAEAAEATPVENYVKPSGHLQRLERKDQGAGTQLRS